MNAETKLQGLGLLFLCSLFIQAGCVPSQPQESTARPDLTAWFNATTCEFSQGATTKNKLADSLGRFCKNPAPKTETVMIVQLDAQNKKGIAVCDFSDTIACEHVAEFCDKNDGVGHCERDKCYCEYKLAQ